MWKVWSEANKDFSLNGTSWEPKKLQNFDIKKNLWRRKKERKKKNIGYRVASNERRLIKQIFTLILNLDFKFQIIFTELQMVANIYFLSIIKVTE